VLKIAVVLSSACLVSVSVFASGNALADPAPGADAFPIGGTYLENEICKGDGSDAADKRVKITPTAIDSSFGICTLQDIRRQGDKFTVQVICKDPAGGSLSSDVSFTIRDANTLEFADQYETYKATLHKCPQ
jgi:hypothetical protein